MLTDFLQLAARQKLFSGMCVHPTSRAGYLVRIWAGPSLGERIEWSECFTPDVPPSEALDRLAATAEQALARRSTTYQTSPALFFRPKLAPDASRIRPEQRPDRSFGHCAEAFVLTENGRG